MDTYTNSIDESSTFEITKRCSNTLDNLKAQNKNTKETNIADYINVHLSISERERKRSRTYWKKL